MIKASRLWAMVLLPAALSVGAAAHCLAEAGEQLVYWPLVTDGNEYRRVSYPRRRDPSASLRTPRS